MKDKEKQIEEKFEMARIIAFDLCPNGKYHKELYRDKALCYSNDNFAECSKIEDVVDKLYNEGYRKLPKDSVVLSREELTKEPCNEFCKGCPNARTRSSGIIACAADYNCQQFTRYANLLDKYKQLEQKNYQLEQNLEQCENGYELELHTARCQVHFMEEDVEKLKQNLKKASKETAEKFIQFVYGRCTDFSFIRKIENFAKQFGVEIKE